MLLQFFNPLCALNYPSWIYGTATAEKKKTVKETLFASIEALCEGLVELNGTAFGDDTDQ